MRHRLPALTALALLVLAGCGDGAATQAERASTDVPSGTWVSTSIEESPPAKAPLVQPDRIYLQFFDDGRVLISGGCNGTQGTLRIDRGQFVVADRATTAAGCLDANAHRRDDWIEAFLATPPSYAYDGKRIGLTTPAISVALGPMEEVEPDLPLEGPRWELTTIAQGPAAADPAPDSVVGARPAPEGAYLLFRDGRVTGNDGCNFVDGTAAIEGDTIRFADLVSTTAACPTGSGAEQIRAVLDGTVRWEINRRWLSLTHPSGLGLSLSSG